MFHKTLICDAPGRDGGGDAQGLGLWDRFFMVLALIVEEGGIEIPDTKR